MTISPDVAAESTRTPRTQRLRHYAMTPPTYFTVEYAINPWMDTSTPVDARLALAQWENLRDTYVRLGHTVDLVAPVAGLPDMVYAANAGLIINGTAVVAQFKHAERYGESVAYAAWMAERGHDPVATRHVNEGQGDLLVVGSMILAGTGFRTHPHAHAEIADLTGMPVISLELVDPRFYHLDTALSVLDDSTIAYYPPAFTDHARAQLRRLFPDAIEVASTDAYVLGLNAVSDGKHVVHPAQATGFAEQLYHAGFHPIGVDLSELLKGGGSVKCCTLEVFS
ncbi:dimethylargininase [Mycolicibacterium pallens]|uniref:N-dimethylarginine dimethylaminohydrolase n=1 Tax=Mycolicibacterium pallens TaxID=370524 RepID=A0ABX8VJE9_9MYCO|nr:dimethylargininase [Mycolicibacterium pallens]APE16627.1 N-dimethylarginine dimethylaminohydrolase [Mycobacterium sp. WY10]QYL17920.1 N-dimethylarginine dimethylaminohydrolase [Mycolicibacterium pallens]